MKLVGFALVHMIYRGGVLAGMVCCTDSLTWPTGRTPCLNSITAAQSAPILAYRNSCRSELSTRVLCGDCHDLWVYNSTSATVAFFFPQHSFLSIITSDLSDTEHLLNITTYPTILKHCAKPDIMSTHTLSPKSSNDSLQSRCSASSSPDKLAPALTGPMVWEKLDVADYIVDLTPREVQDIRAAVIKVKSKFGCPS